MFRRRGAGGLPMRAQRGVGVLARGQIPRVGSASPRAYRGWAVRLKLPPAVVRVKYKTTRCCGAFAGTPQSWHCDTKAANLLGFRCGKCQTGALMAGYKVCSTGRFSGPEDRVEPQGSLRRADGKKTGGKQGLFFPFAEAIVRRSFSSSKSLPAFTNLRMETPPKVIYTSCNHRG